MTPSRFLTKSCAPVAATLCWKALLHFAKRTGVCLSRLVPAMIAWAVLGAVTGFAAETRLVTHPTAESSVLLDPSGQLWLWGHLGLPAPRPVTAPDVSRWRTAAGGARVLAVDLSGRLWGWGLAGVHFTGQPTLVTNVPFRVRAVAPTQGIRDLLLGEDGELWMYRFVGKVAAPESKAFSDYLPSKVADPRAVGGWKQIASGANHSLLLTGSGQVFATGENLMGQVSTQRTVGYHEALVLVPPPAPHLHWQQVACGTDTSFGRASNGEWYWWGALVSLNANQAVKSASRTPIRLLRPKEVNTWQQVAAGDSFILLLSDGGRVYGLGDNTAGTLGYPEQNAWALSYTNVPQRVFAVGPQTNRVVAVGTGARHALAVDERGELYTWGSNVGGQLGRPVADGDWRPDRVLGDQVPFSPAAEAWPRLEWVPIQPRIQAPVLAGQPGQSARFELHRRGGPAVAIPLRFRSSVGGLPFGRVQMKVNGVVQSFPSVRDFTLGATNSLIAVEFTPELSPFPAVSTQVELFAAGPVWVDWTGPSSTPLEIDIPTQWSLPPTVNVQFRPGLAYLNETNAITVQASDPDGWIVSVEVFLEPPRAGPELFSARRLVPRTKNRNVTLAIPWVPRGSAPSMLGGYSAYAIVRDNSGSVVTSQRSFQRLFERSPVASRFRVEWEDTGLLAEAGAPLRLRIEDLQPELPITGASLRFGSEALTPIEVPLPREVSVVLTQSGVVGCSVEFTTPSGFARVHLPSRWVRSPGGPPFVTLEATDPEADEASGDPGQVRVTRIGGDFSEPLEVVLSVGAPNPELVPVPRDFLGAWAEPGLDFEATRWSSLVSVTIPAGEATATFEVRPLRDELVEGNEAVVLTVVRESLDDYELPPIESRSAQIVIRDAQRAQLPTVRIRSPQAGQSVNPAIGIAVDFTVTKDPMLTLRQRELYVDGVLMNSPGNVPAPLPVGPLTLQAKVTDSFGQEGWSEPVTIHVTPGLKLQSRQANADGTECWELAAEPLFQELRLESAPEIGRWQPLLDWRPTPTNRLQSVTVPAGSDARFLRLVPAHEE